MVLDVFYNVLFHPVSEFQRIAEEKDKINVRLAVALFFVVLISATAPVVAMGWKGSDIFTGLVFAVPAQVIIGILSWFWVSALICGASYVFSGEGHFRVFLTLSAFSFIPWIFMGPVMLFKVSLSSVGIFLGITLGLALWLWSIFLFALAIGVSFKLSLDKVLMVIMMPFGFLMVALFWSLEFIGNIQQLMP